MNKMLLKFGNKPKEPGLGIGRPAGLYGSGFQ